MLSSWWYTSRMSYEQTYHATYTSKARDALSEVIINLQNVREKVVTERLLDVEEALRIIDTQLEPILSRMRTEAWHEHNEITRDPDYRRMLAGEIAYPGERLPEPVVLPEVERFPQGPPPEAAPFPNAKTGEMIVMFHGSVDAALAVVTEEEAEHVRAYLTLNGQRPPGWTPLGTNFRHDED